jgi:hypothetical protein
MVTPPLSQAAITRKPILINSKTLSLSISQQIKASLNMPPPSVQKARKSSFSRPSSKIINTDNSAQKWLKKQAWCILTSRIEQVKTIWLHWICTVKFTKRSGWLTGNSSKTLTQTIEIIVQESGKIIGHQAAWEKVEHNLLSSTRTSAEGFITLNLATIKGDLKALFLESKTWDLKLNQRPKSR